MSPERFHVIIAGAGPAGCVLASRLSENAETKVLLLDQGPDVVVPGAEHPDVVDSFALMASNNTTFHWPGLTAHIGGDQSARSTSPYIQGYGVGGASNINGMGVDRGQPGDYSEWCALGARGWNWNQVLPHFKAIEHDLDFSTSEPDSMHGCCGPMPVMRLRRPYWAPFATAFGQAVESRGFPFIEDYTADFREGFSAAPLNCLSDRRISAAMGYLTRVVRSRPNLTIMPNTRVDRLSLDGKRVTGLYADRSGQSYHIVGNEVILSCGAIGSPAVLLRSGIGPAKTIRRHGISVVHDLPGVGANLQNHPCVILTTYLRAHAAQARADRLLLQNWLRFSSGRPDCPSCDMHLMPFNRCDWHSLGGRIGALTVSVLKSYSKGHVDLASSDPFLPPTVHFNMLSERRDDERLVDGVRFALELLCDPIVAKTRHEIFIPSPRVIASIRDRTPWNRMKVTALSSVLEFSPLRCALPVDARVDPNMLRSDREALRDFVHRHVQPQYHACGTCRMGADEDPNVVVDGTGRVRGIAALRVVDSSIFPVIPRGYPHFVVLM